MAQHPIPMTTPPTKNPPEPKGPTYPRRPWPDDVPCCDDDEPPSPPDDDGADASNAPRPPPPPTDPLATHLAGLANPALLCHSLSRCPPNAPPTHLAATASSTTSPLPTHDGPTANAAVDVLASDPPPPAPDPYPTRVSATTLAVRMPSPSPPPPTRLLSPLMLRHSLACQS